MGKLFAYLRILRTESSIIVWDLVGLFLSLVLGPERHFTFICSNYHSSFFVIKLSCEKLNMQNGGCRAKLPCCLLALFFTYQPIKVWIPVSPFSPPLTFVQGYFGRHLLSKNLVSVEAVVHLDLMCRNADGFLPLVVQS